MRFQLYSTYPSNTSSVLTEKEKTDKTTEKLSSSFLMRSVLQVSRTQILATFQCCYNSHFFPTHLGLFRNSLRRHQKTQIRAAKTTRQTCNHFGGIQGTLER